MSRICIHKGHVKATKQAVLIKLNGNRRIYNVAHSLLKRKRTRKVGQGATYNKFKKERAWAGRLLLGTAAFYRAKA